MSLRVFILLLVSGCAAVCETEDDVDLADVDLAVVGGEVVTAYGAEAVTDGVVLMRGDRIACVGSRAQCPAPEGVRVIDAAGGVVAPGLIDAHVHYAQTGWFDGSPAGFNAAAVYDKAEIHRAAAARRGVADDAYLCAGVTAVYDMGGPLWTLKHASESPVLRAAAGPILTDVPDAFLTLFNSEEAVTLVSARTPEAMRREAGALAAAGVDMLKVLLSPSSANSAARYDALVGAAVEAAAVAGTPVVLHALQRRDAAAGVRLGVGALVHSVTDAPLGEALASEMAERGTAYIPTYVVRRRLADGYAIVLEGRERHAPDPLGCLDGRTARLIEADAEKLAGTAPASMQTDSFAKLQIAIARREEAAMAANLRTAFEAGVTVAMGSDAGNPNTPHGLGLFYELTALEAAGFELEKLLRAATLGGAAALGLDDEIGRLAEGARADLVIYDRDPRAGAENLMTVRTVIVGGRVR